MNKVGTSVSIQSVLIALCVVLSASFLGCNREQQTQTTPQPVYQQEQPPIVHQHQQPPPPRQGVSHLTTETRWVELPAFILYASGSTRLNDENRAMLREAHASMAHRTDIIRVKVIGHSDSRGNAESRRRTAQERAQSVVDFFVGELGMPRELFEIENRGSDDRITSEASAGDRLLNRRVEFEILVRRTSAQ